MISLLIAVFRSILIVLLKTAALSFLHPHLLKLDKWCEEKLGIDIIKQDKKFHEKYPLIAKRLKKVEENSHPCKELHEFEVYPELIGRIDEIERRLKIKK
tara:strand:- start:2421 stop:2720 length:300 start_codon:yes stop_codon:yes gene_type:complete